MSHLGKTLALTPALSPRRGRAIVRLFTLCPSRLQSAPSCVLFRKQYDHPTRSYRPHAGERFTLSWGERAGVRASVPLTFLSLLHSNTSRNPTGPTHFAESIAFAPDFQGIGSSTVNLSAMRIKCRAERSDDGALGWGEECRQFESGVALRLPPHSKTLSACRRFGRREMLRLPGYFIFLAASWGLQLNAPHS